MYTEATTKDGNLGVIIVAETISQVLDECMSWVKANGIKAKDVVANKLIDLTSNKEIGIISFSEDKVVCIPNV